jgi:pSer/pThr/pTyr-binding forkhead associated (FHA) protein
MSKLIFTAPGFEGQSFELPEGKTTVGRAPDNTLIIDDHCISAHHCQILRYGREIIVRETGSSNGTWVDGCQLRGQTSLRNGQRIRFASVEARLEMPPPEIQKDDTEFTAIYLHARASREPAAAPKPPLATIIKPRLPTPAHDLAA